MKSLSKHRPWAKLLLVTLGLSFFIPVYPADARIRFKAPEGLGSPGRRIAGGSRSIEQDSCSSKKSNLTAVVPNSNIGLTTQANPIFFVYIPQTSAQTLELAVRDESQPGLNTKTYKQIYKPSGKAGIVGIPITATSLEVGKKYRWFFTIICNSRERSKDRVVYGNIKRITVEPQLARKLENSTPQQRANLYAEAGIWQDSIANLAQSLSANPNNPELKADWQALLTSKSVGLDNLVAEPLLQGQQQPQLITSN